MKDVQTIEMWLYPEKTLSNITSWFELSREERQVFIAKYIDSIGLIKNEDKIEITNINFRETIFIDMLNYHKQYNLPLDNYLFVDRYDNKIPVQAKGIKTKEQANEYVEKLRKFYDVNYYESTLDLEDFSGSFASQTEVEKIIRIIPLEDKNKYVNDKVELGVIGLDLSDVKTSYGMHIYKEEQPQQIN